METTLREPRPEKVAVVDEVRERFGAAGAAILTEYRGLAVKDMEALRRSLRQAGGEYKVYKNTLVRRAAHEAGLDVLDALLEGPTAIAFVDGDVAAVAKVLRDFARTNPNLVVKGGLLGENLLDAQRASALADLPSREVLLAQIAGLLASPLRQFAGLLQAVPQRFAYALQALAEQRQGDAPVAAGEGPSASEETPATDEGPAAAGAQPTAEAEAAAAAAASEAATGDETAETDVTAEPSEEAPGAEA